jgi:hypothetical protein
VPITPSGSHQTAHDIYGGDTWTPSTEDPVALDEADPAGAAQPPSSWAADAHHEDLAALVHTDGLPDEDHP